MKKVLILLALSSFLLASCGGSSDGEKTNLSETQGTTKVKLNLDGTDIVDLDDYSIVSSSESIKASEQSLQIDKDDKDLVSLVDSIGKPFLIGRKLAGDEDVELSLESSAEMFVLFQPRFFGTESNNPQELSNRIRNHPRFSELTKRIAFEIKNNPCPLDPQCSSRPYLIASDIADTLSIDDLYSVGE